MKFNLHLFVLTSIDSEKFPEPTLVKAATRIEYNVANSNPERTAVFSEQIDSSVMDIEFPASFTLYTSLYPFITPFSHPLGTGFHSTTMNQESLRTKLKFIGGELGTRGLDTVHVTVNNELLDLKK